MLPVAAFFALSGSGLGSPPIAWELPSTDGRHLRAEDFATKRATVLLFLAIDCPISKRYSPLIQTLETAFRSKGVAFLAIFSDPSESASAAKQYLADYGLFMPGLMDSSASLAKQTGARVTPEAVVLSPARAVLYRGRIDDRYVTWGKTRPQATTQDLRDALDAVIAGKSVLHPFAKPFGCAIPGL